VLNTTWATNHAGGLCVKPVRFRRKNTNGVSNASVPAMPALWENVEPGNDRPPRNSVNAKASTAQASSHNREDLLKSGRSLGKGFTKSS
jgi:hypothetical protein